MKITDIEANYGFTVTLDDRRVINAVPVFDAATQKVSFPDVPADVATLLNQVTSNPEYLKIYNGLYPGVVGSGDGGGGGPSSVTLVVSPTAGEGDYTTIQAAIDALPAAGGTIALREGTYSLTSTITLPNKDVTIRGCGNSSKVDLGSNAIAGFTIPDGMTQDRKFVFQDFLMKGGSVANQVMFAYQDGDSNSCFSVVRVNVPDASIETILNIQDYNQTASRNLRITFEYCSIFPTSLATSTFIKCVNPAGNTSGGIQITWSYCILKNTFDTSEFSRFWEIDAAVDIELSHCSMVFNADTAVNGLRLISSDIYIQGGDLTIFGATTFLQDTIHDCIVFGIDFATFDPSRVIFKGNLQPYFISDTVFSATTVRVEGGGDPVHITGCYFPSGGGTSAMGIDVQNRPLTRIANCDFGDPFGSHTAQAILLNNALFTTITGCGFTNQGGATKTIVETGTTNKTMVAGCVGISSGGGFVKIGAASLIAAGTVNIA